MTGVLDLAGDAAPEADPVVLPKDDARPIPTTCAARCSA